MSVYRFLEDAYINDRYYQAGTIASTADAGGSLPFGWVPTGNVDPIDTSSVSSFFAAGEQTPGLIRTQFTPNYVQFPNTYWKDGQLISSGDFPNNLNQYYWTGAVDFFPDTILSGGSAVALRSPFGVISYWVNLGDVCNTNLPFGANFARIYQPGSNVPTYRPEVGMSTMNSYVIAGTDFISDIGIGLVLYDIISGNILTDCQVQIGPKELVSGPRAPITGWHHCIWSWDASQIVNSTIRVQFAFDRGGTPFESLGGGLYDTAQGTTGNPTPPPYPAPQPMWYVSPDSLNGVTGLVDATAKSSEWQIMTDPLQIMHYAYCYAGLSDAFFDLTNPKNLDQFVTGARAPVDLGYAGRNPTNQQTGNPLICLFMHTGGTNLTDVNIAQYETTKIYEPSSDSSILGFKSATIVRNGTLAYQCLQRNGPFTAFGVVVPGSNPLVWQQIDYPYGQPQFALNGANGTVWKLTGTGGMGNAFTQPGLEI